MATRHTKERLFEVMSKVNPEFINEFYQTNRPFQYAQDVLGDLFKWWNQGESKEYNSEERFDTTYAIDIPKAEYNDEVYENIKYKHQGSSHGIEGNPGGVVTSGNVSDPHDMGEYVRIYINDSSVLDI